MTIFTALFLILLVLKLTGYIALSWWWITAPLWGTVLFGLIWITTMFSFCLRIQRD